MSQFVDEVSVNVKGGDGGAGCVSFRREAMVARGGPDGGDGGKGGDVWFVADHNVASLLAYRDHPHRKSESGKHGSGAKKHGVSGKDFIAPVPVGTIIKNFDGDVLADLSRDGDRWLAAAGGQGGKGNNRFLTNKRRAPAFAEQGEVGEETWLRLELRLAADVALIGFPNAGKSTLISRISAAKPKIADYPFTTLTPNLGVVTTDDGFDYVVADIPGLIEGASEGRGLGHQFLRHVERARVLVVLLDLASVEEQSPEDQLAMLLDELGAYRPDLLERPRLVVDAKTDVAIYDTNPDHLPLSAVTNQGLRELVGRMADLVREARKDDVDVGGERVIHRPTSREISVARNDDGSWTVNGRAAERAIALSDMTNEDAILYAQERLQKLGVNRKLAKAGARQGDTVYLGVMSFEYEPDIQQYEPDGPRT